ncbi:MAG: RNB domain-containing ribonuclease [Microbacterium sp.]|nr:MAG: RNB domain-containing ribonuclease [Microbacterium sp.]
MPVRRSRIVPAEVRADLAASLSALRRSLDVPEAFPAAVQAEAERVARDVAVSPGADLADLRDIEFLTIDPAGSTDLDQALHLERTAGGAVLHYAIADVPAYVIPGGALDDEARKRGQTLYAPDGRVPLHPAVISEGAASLLPDQDRRAFVWRFVLDDGARPVETTLTRAVVRSRRQWSYTDAQAAIDDGTAPPSLAAMPWFGAERTARERERGGASLNVPESRVISEGDGYRLERSEGVPLEDWNAHVSLMTGMAAAEIMVRGGIGILRTMPPAQPEDVADFRSQTIALGIPWRLDVPYGDYLRALDRSSPARAVKEYAAGLFRGAGYVAFDGDVPEEIVQAAIGAPYAHTTAPLRRLVDRWSLVICDALANRRDVPDWARAGLAELPELMSRSSQRASQLTAGALDRVEAAVLHGQEGQEFSATVLAMRGDGARVQLQRPPVDVKVAGLEAEPGAVVRLRLVQADVDQGTVAFAPVSVSAETEPT